MSKLMEELGALTHIDPTNLACVEIFNDSIYKVACRCSTRSDFMSTIDSLHLICCGFLWCGESLSW